MAAFNSRRRGEQRPRAVLAFALASGAVLLAPRFLVFIAGSGPQLRNQHSRASANFQGRCVVAAGVAGVSSPTLADAKAKLLDLLEDSSLEQEVLRPEGKPMRGRVDEAIVSLERFNAQNEPVYSTLLDGTWNVKYAGSYAPGLLSSPTREIALFLYGGGFSLGNALSSFTQGFWGQTLGMKLGSKTVLIQGGRDVVASAIIEVAGRKDTLSYKSELMPLSASRMSEEVVSIVLPDPLGKQDLPLELRRSILVTYLDEDLMVVRDESGIPEVLQRDQSAMPSASREVFATTTGTKDDQDRALLDAAGSEAS